MRTNYNKYELVLLVDTLCSYWTDNDLYCFIYALFNNMQLF